MRFSIKPEGGESIILRADAEPTKIGWYIAEDGIHGWFGTPEPREDVIRRYTSNGDAWPPSLSNTGITTQGARVFSFDVIARFDSTIECSKGIDRINALIGKLVTVTSYETRGSRTLECYLSDDPDPELTTDEQAFLATLEFTAPYPIKRGEIRKYPVTGSSVKVLNNGNCHAYPILVLEKCTAASVSRDGHTVSWSGSASELLEIDLSKDLSNISGITNDDAFSVAPGWSTLNISHTGGTCSIKLADAWR